MQCVQGGSHLVGYVFNVFLHVHITLKTQLHFNGSAYPSAPQNPFFKPEEFENVSFTVLVWVENILKTEPFEKDDVTIISIVFLPEFQSNRIPK